MNDHERLVAEHLQALEKLLQESLKWEDELCAGQDRRVRHNEWADARQPLFEQHVQAVRAGMQTSGQVTRRERPRKKVVKAWTPEAVEGRYDYVVETHSRVGPVFARQASERLAELERAWDGQMEKLYTLSRR